MWKQPDVLDLLRAARAAARPRPRRGAGLLRPGPARRQGTFSARPAQPAGPGPRIDAVVDDEPAYPPQLAAPAVPRQLEGAKALAKDNPAAVAGIVRGWVGGSEAA